MSCEPRVAIFWMVATAASVPGGLWLESALQR